MPDAHTFLFADLVGYTALADAEGDDRAAEVALTLQRRIRELLQGHGGEEVKGLGDGVMLRCAEPAAAVRLGLRIVDEFGSDPSCPPVRVGIHTGPAVAHRGDWYGRTVNVASRLCSVAAGGEVLVSDATRASAGRIRKVDFGERKLHWLRNVTEPIGTYSARERSWPVHSFLAAAARVTRQRPGATARLEAV
jgi:adenylate cyclase